MKPLNIIFFPSNLHFETILNYSSQFRTFFNQYQLCTSTFTNIAPFSAKVAIFVFGFRWLWNPSISFSFHQIFILILFQIILVHLEHCSTKIIWVLAHLPLRHLLAQKLPYLYLASSYYGTLEYHFLSIKSSFWGSFRVF